MRDWLKSLLRKINRTFNDNMGSDHPPKLFQSHCTVVYSHPVMDLKCPNQTVKIKAKAIERNNHKRSERLAQESRAQDKQNFQ
eukprot:scaffold156036_cov32-Attheya_sp.AAC.2